LNHHAQGTQKVVLHAGDYCFDQAGTQIHTLLGSCVSITLWHPELKVGGMCHYALPYQQDDQSRKLNPRFADDCIQLFNRSVRRYGTVISDYHVKIFGGGNMYEKQVNNNISDEKRLPVGDKNVIAAYELLQKEGAQILVAHVGEFGYRKIVFDISSGDVWVKFTPVGKSIGDLRSLSGLN
jgi:chemotaxis protein CheD